VEPGGLSHDGEAGAPERVITVPVDKGAIESICHAGALNLRVLCPLKPLSLNLILRRAERALESTEEESYELQVDEREFDMLQTPGTTVYFRNGSKDASFSVSGLPMPGPQFIDEAPLLENMMKREQDGWL
jgi:hypothetical protein